MTTIRLGSVNLAVRDIAATERFYVDVLGLRVDEERSHRPGFVLLRTANCMITLQQQLDATVELGFEVEDVAAMQARLGPDRAVVQQMGWGDAIETTDPDGNRLNLYRLRD